MEKWKEKLPTLGKTTIGSSSLPEGLTASFHEDFLVIDGVEPFKPTILDRIVSFLKSLLEKLFWCLTCGCCHGDLDDGSSHSSSRELSPRESAAVQRLMDLLESEESSSCPTITQEHQQCLLILAKAKFESLQKLAASSYLIFALNTTHIYEFWELEPLLYLLRVGIPSVKLQATEALFHMVHNGASGNKAVFIAQGCLPSLMQLLQLPDFNIAIIVLATLTSLLTDVSAQELFHNQDYVNTILYLMKSKNKHVRLGAVGVLLNYTRHESSAEHLSTKQAVDALGEALCTEEYTCLAHSSAIVCNLAIRPTFRTLVAQQSRWTVLRQLVKLMLYHDSKVRLNACSALRNLACSAEVQLVLVQLDSLPVLKTVIVESSSQTLVTSLSLLKNIALHKTCEVKIVEETFLHQLERIMRLKELPEAQEMAAMVIRNISSQATIEKILNAKCVEAFIDTLGSDETTEDVLLSVAVGLGVLTDHVTARHRVIHYQGGKCFTKVIQLASKHSNVTMRESCAGILGHISTIVIPPALLDVNIGPLLYYFQRALSSTSVELLHIALWTLPKFLAYTAFREAFNQRRLAEVVEIQTDFGVTENIKSLARLSIQMAAIPLGSQ